MVLIAPFWDDSDNSAGGQVFYRFTDDQAILDDVSSRINGAFPVNFNPLSAFIVTWYQLPQFLGDLSVVCDNSGQGHIAVHARRGHN